MPAFEQKRSIAPHLATVSSTSTSPPFTGTSIYTGDVPGLAVGSGITLSFSGSVNYQAYDSNGIQVVDWVDNRPMNANPRNGCRLEAGHISIQGHDPTTDLSFRNLRIAEYPTK